MYPYICNLQIKQDDTTFHTGLLIKNAQGDSQRFGYLLVCRALNEEKAISIFKEMLEDYLRNTFNHLPEDHLYLPFNLNRVNHESVSKRYRGELVSKKLIELLESKYNFCILKHNSWKFKK